MYTKCGKLAIDQLGELIFDVHKSYSFKMSEFDSRYAYRELTLQGIFQRISPYIDSSLHSLKFPRVLYKLG